MGWHRYGLACHGVNEDVMTAPSAVEPPADLLQSPNQLPRLEGRELVAHTARTTTRS